MKHDDTQIIPNLLRPACFSVFLGQVFQVRPGFTGLLLVQKWAFFLGVSRNSADLRSSTCNPKTNSSLNARKLCRAPRSSSSSRRDGEMERDEISG